MNERAGEADKEPKIVVRQLDFHGADAAAFLKLVQNNRTELERFGTIPQGYYSTLKQIRRLPHTLTNTKYYGIYLGRNSDTPVGVVVFSNRPDLSDAVGVIGYFVDQEQWGKNVAVRAVESVIRWHSRCRTFYAAIDPDNAASAKVAFRLGFQLQSGRNGSSIGNLSTDLLFMLRRM